MALELQQTGLEPLAFNQLQMPSQSKGVLGFMKCNQKSSSSTDRFLGCIDVGDWELGSFCLGGNEKKQVG
jgi:hypothetical protein